jgi:GTP-binding protein
MFVDNAQVFVKAGKGGDGAVSFRHEKYVDKGGPDGGDGGRGGDVVFRATKDLNTLLNFRYKPELIAENGQGGSKRNRRGRSGEPLVVKVPMGTLVRRDGIVVADLIIDGQEAVVARGGDGGFGNAHFKSSTRQAPRIGELGEPGDEFEAQLELKLLADVGLVGFPNAGKSTFLSVVSNARPEIANYEFTTLTPNLGVADVDDGSILIADIPGLIEGASEGKGLGDQFLRHVERTAVLLHMIDAYSDDPAEKYQTIRRELEKYSPELMRRPEVVVLTKCEGLDQEIIAMQATAIQNVAPEAEVLTISSQTHEGVKELLRLLRAKVEARRQEEAALAAEESDVVEGMPVISLSEEQVADAWTVEREAGGYRVVGEKIEKFARRTNFEQFEAVNRLRDIMRKLGITHELIRQGAIGESVVYIGEAEFTLVEQ